jgi:transposase-like protein
LGWVAMSERDVQRIRVLSEVLAGRRTTTSAAALLDIIPRQARRLRNRLRGGGGGAISHRLRGRPSNRRIAPELRDHAVALVRERYPDFGPALAVEKLAELHGLNVSAETLRKWMIEAGLWRSRKQRRTFHQPRSRRESLGELVQIDGSEHRWFEGRAAPCTLLVFIDDATGRLMQLRFVDSESTEAYFAALRGYLETHGCPVAFYSDKHSVFRPTRQEAKAGQGVTQFGRALSELNIQILCAHSSQAKGRVERVNRTLQDRLVKEMRLAGISSITAGNEFLPGFMERFNARFAVTPASSADLHCRLNVSAERLRDILCHRVLRRTDAQLTLSYERKRIMLVRNEITEALAGQCLDIYHFADGQVDVRWKGLSLPYRVFDKEQRVNQAEIVENKRLGAALAFVKAMQDAPRQPVRVKSASEASGYTPRARKARRRSWLLPAMA